MRWILIIILSLGVALVVLSLLGQSSSFYLWRGQEVELARAAAQFEESAQQSIRAVAFQHMPRGTYWFAIRLSGIAVIATAAVGLWMQRRRA